MATYKSSYTGPQIDQAVGNALNKDTSTLSNDVNHIPASSVVKSALNTVDESVAIRVSGNKTTYASGAAIGQYVIVDGSTITGITDGLYKAAKAIPYNTAIDSTYLTAVSGGGMNDLKSALNKLVYRVTFTLPDSTGYFTTPAGTYPSFADRNNTIVLATAYINADGNYVFAYPDTDYKMVHYAYGNLINANLAGRTAVMVCASF